MRQLFDYRFTFFLFTAFSIISSSYVGLNGSHVWRQADVYSQIYGFLGKSGLNGFNGFNGTVVLFDMPLYQFLITALTKLINGQSLIVTKYVDYLCLAVIGLSAIRITSYYSLFAAPFSLLLIGTSPVILHFFATPLPDTLAIALSISGLALFYAKDIDWLKIISATLLIGISAFIKSPIAFIFIVFLVIFLLVEKSKWLFQNIVKIIPIFVVSLIAALAAEFIRRLYLTTDVSGFAQDPTWYFGAIELRLSFEFWSKMWERYLGSFAFEFIGKMLLVFLAGYSLKFFKQAKQLLPFIISFFSGWLIFANVYEWHDYYQLPVIT